MNGSSDTVSVIVVARHGERLDYYIRDNPDAASGNTNWVATASRPFDPPLTMHGREQAVKLGRHLAAELEKLNLPQISEIYSSPLLRCRETAIGARSGLVSEVESLPIRVEPGLVESINEPWYRSWALPGSDGTWGFYIDDKKAYDPEMIHSLAKQPVQALLEEWKSDDRLDLAYVPKTSVLKPYCFNPPLFETNIQQRSRMKDVVAAVSETRGKSVLLVSHGGPVTHLYEELTGNFWFVHGESKYCCYSIYINTSADTENSWKPLQVNQSEYLNEKMHGDQYIDDDP